MELDAGWGDEYRFGRGMDVLDGMEIVEVEGASMAIVTSGDFVASLFSAAKGGDVALPILLWAELLLLYTDDVGRRLVERSPGDAAAVYRHQPTAAQGGHVGRRRPGVTAEPSPGGQLGGHGGQPAPVGEACVERPEDGATDDDVEEDRGADDERSAPLERRQQPLGQRSKHERTDTRPRHRDACVHIFTYYTHRFRLLNRVGIPILALVKAGMSHVTSFSYITLHYVLHLI